MTKPETQITASDREAAEKYADGLTDSGRRIDIPCDKWDFSAAFLAGILKERARAEDLIAQIEVFALPALKRVVKGCDMGVPTVANSGAHKDCSFAVERIERSLKTWRGEK